MAKFCWVLVFCALAVDMLQVNCLPAVGSNVGSKEISEQTTVSYVKEESGDQHRASLRHQGRRAHGHNRNTGYHGNATDANDNTPLLQKNATEVREDFEVTEETKEKVETGGMPLRSQTGNVKSAATDIEGTAYLDSVNETGNGFQEGHNEKLSNGTSCGSKQNITENKPLDVSDAGATKLYLKKLFDKYGSGGTMNIEGLEHLLESLGLGGKIIFDHDLSSHDENGTFVSLHKDHNHTAPEIQHNMHENQASENLDNNHEGHDHSHGNHGHEDHDHEDHEDHNHSKREVVVEDQTTRSMEEGPAGAMAGSKSVRKRRAPLADSESECINTASLLESRGLSEGDQLNFEDFRQLCPILIYQLDHHSCYGDDGGHVHDHEPDRHLHRQMPLAEGGDPNWTDGQKWGYSLLSCIIISLLSLAGAPLIPLMNRVFYNHLLQFMVAMAIGTLSGDALLHLLPHAMVPHDHSRPANHDDTEVPDEHHHGNQGDSRHAVWLGLVALSGIYVFFLVERLMAVLTTWKRKRNSKKIQKRSPSRESTEPANEEEVERLRANSKQQEDREQESKGTSCEGHMMVVHTSKDVSGFANEAHHEAHGDCKPEVKGDILHAHGHHGHSHHGNKVPGSVAAVAWMVIMGDGVHNFSDGLAIGAAFAESLPSGVSTSIAVFCHELPHELGDFAVLLTAGMTVKQALFYNFVSALISLLGNVIGVALGNATSFTPWILCLIAGMFLYVALVDMLPELTKMTSKEGEPPFFHLVLQNIGLILGACIMLLIAIFEGQIVF